MISPPSLFSAFPTAGAPDRSIGQPIFFSPAQTSRQKCGFRSDFPMGERPQT
jgi:hypothetical protein